MKKHLFIILIIALISNGAIFIINPGGNVVKEDSAQYERFAWNLSKASFSRV